MERNRRAGAASGSGGVLGTRRQRGRNPSDEEDKMEETSELRFGKRPKKDMYGLSTSCLSASANSLNKRKRWGLPQDSGRHAEAHESREAHELKADDDDVPSSAPHLQKHVKSSVQSKEDKFFMDIAVVPRKPRSSISLSSRLTSTTRKQQVLCFTQQQSPVMTLNGSSFPYGTFPSLRKRLKPSGTEPHAMKVSQGCDFLAVSDQEAEVAEALFVLARSTPSRAGVLDSNLEAKLGTEAKCASSSATSQRFVVVPSSLGPDFASAVPIGNRSQVAEKKEGKFPIVSSPSELPHSSVGETELESALPRAHSLAGEAHSFPSETSNSKMPAGSPHCAPRWPQETIPRSLEEQYDDFSGAKKVKQEAQINADMEESQPEVCLVKRTPTATQRNTVDSSGNHDEPHLSSRSDAVRDFDGCISTSKIDLMTPSTIFKLEALHENWGELSSHVLGKEDSVKGLNTDNGYLKLKGRAAGGIQGSNEEFEEQKEQPTSETVRRLQDGDMKEDHSSKPSPNRKINDTGNSSVSSCFSSLSSTAVSGHAPIGLAGWMSGFSQLGYHGSAPTSWAATSSLSIDMKAAHPAMQLPHAAISSPVPKMKNCATHVYVAYYIHRQQQAIQHSLWSAALCRATTYNRNVPPVKPLDNDRPREAYTGFTQKAQTHQTEPSFAYNISQSSMRRMASSGSTHGSGVAGSISASNLPTSSRASSETSTVTASGHAMAVHAQYLQTMMRQTGFASFPYPVSGSPGQAAQFFNGPFFQPHLIPHLQPLTQQAANVLPVHKQQQAKGASSSPVEQQQAQAVLQSLSQSQQQPQNLVETSASDSNALERESKVGGESFPMAESRSSARNLCGLDSFKVLNLNVCPSPPMLVTVRPAMRSHDQDLSLMATSGGGHIGKSQQTSASLSSGQQQHLNTLSGIGHHVKGIDQSFSSTPAMIGVSKQPVGTRPRGLLSEASKVATGVLPGSCKRDHNHRNSHEAASVNDNAFTMKGQDHTEEKRATIKQGVWSPPLSVYKGDPSSVLESSSDGKDPLWQQQQQQALPLHSLTVTAQHIEQAGWAQQCLHPDSQTLHIQQEQPQAASSHTSATNDGLHPSSLDYTSGTTILETPTNLEYSKPTLDGEIQQGLNSAAIFSFSLPSQTTVASS